MDRKIDDQKSQTKLTGYKTTELGPLPQEWEVVRLGDVAEFVRGLSWRKSEETDKQNGKLIISIPNIGEDGINFDTKYNHYLIKNIPENKRLHIGDIIFVGSSGSISNIGRNVKINYLPFEEIGFASFTFKATSNKDKINNDFFYYLLNSGWCRYKEFATRAADGKYNFQLKEFINKNFIPLPPLPEQRKIAAILSTVQKAIETEGKLIERTKELKKSMMHKLFTEGIPRQARNGARSEKQKITEIGPIPESWEVVRLGEVAEVSSGGSAPQGENYFNGDKPFIRVSHIDNEDFTIKSYDLITQEAVKDYKLKLFPKGTIVFPKTGATVYLEKRAMLPVDAYIVSHLCAVISNNVNNIQEFLFYVLKSKKMAKEKADGYPTLNLSEIKEIKIPLPPLPEQQEIANILSTIDQKIEHHTTKKQKLEELFRTLLHELMTARVRVDKINLEFLKMEDEI